jgi:hypothetical protein
MDDQRDKLWNAYLDGELPASEAASFDQSLTPDERKRLAGEIAFERGCAEALSRDAACPDDVWQRTLDALPDGAATVPTTFPWYWKPVAALAAMMLVTISLFAIRVNSAPPEFLGLAELNVPIMQQTDQLGDPSLSKLNAFLEDRNLDVALMPFESGHHPMRLIGARETNFHNENVIELLFSCCDKPVKVALVPQGGDAAEAVGKALGDTLVKASRPVGSQLAVMVGRHESPRLLSYLTDTWNLQTSITVRD